MTNYSVNAATDLMMSASNITTLSPEVKKKLLGAVNLKETIKYAPVLAFYILILVIGLISNSFVLYIYKFKFKRTSARTYILSLALLDFLVCCVGLPYHALDLTHLYTYRYSTLCRVLSFLSASVGLGSVFLLIVVAIDRFRKVCRPLKKQLADFGDKRACAIAVVCAIVIAIPNVIFYGESSAETEGVTGVECFIADEYAESTFAIAYLVFYLLIFIGCVLTLVVIYSFICRTIYKNQALQTVNTPRRGKGCFSCRTDNDSDSDNDSSCSGELRDTLATTTMSEIISEDDKSKHLEQGGRVCLNTVPENLHEDTKQNADQNKTVRISSEEISKKDDVRECLLEEDHDVKDKDNMKVESPPTKKRERKEATGKQARSETVKPMKSIALVRHTTKGTSEKNTRKITLMMLTITVVFILCYFPFIIISLLDSADAEYWDDMTSSEAVFVDFMLRFYLINNMVNAFIYGFWDERFRRECILIIKNIFCCCKSKNNKNKNRK